MDTAMGRTATGSLKVELARRAVLYHSAGPCVRGITSLVTVARYKTRVCCMLQT